MVHKPNLDEEQQSVSKLVWLLSLLLFPPGAAALPLFVSFSSFSLPSYLEGQPNKSVKLIGKKKQYCKADLRPTSPSRHLFSLPMLSGFANLKSTSFILSLFLLVRYVMLLNLLICCSLQPQI